MDKKEFKLYYTMAYNAFDSLVKFTGRQTQDHKKLFIDKIEELADRIKESAENVR